MQKRMTIENALSAVRESADGVYSVLLEHGTLQIGLYKPDRIDPQQPHQKDEVYFVQSGNGFFVCNNERQAVEAGEALFVRAGIEHCFEDFSKDFAAWVVFYGPDGGETT